MVLGADSRVMVSYQDVELELRLPFGSHSRLFLSEVNRVLSGKIQFLVLHSVLISVEVNNAYH